MDWLVEPLGTFNNLHANQNEPRDAECSGSGTQLNQCSCTGGLVACSCGGGLTIKEKVSQSG